MDVISPRKVSREDPSEDALNQDLEIYRQEAVKCKGISEAAVIDQKDIIVDIRAPLKCSIPKCYSYGTSIHCPPLIDISAEKMKQVAKQCTPDCPYLFPDMLIISNNRII